jgi:hypothetical protein
MIRISARKVRIQHYPHAVFEGVVRVWDGKRYLWSRSTGIKRLSRDDAVSDARIFKDEITIPDFNQIRKDKMP